MVDQQDTPRRRTPPSLEALQRGVEVLPPEVIDERVKAVEVGIHGGTNSGEEQPLNTAINSDPAPRELGGARVDVLAQLAGSQSLATNSDGVVVPRHKIREVLRNWKADQQRAQVAESQLATLAAEGVKGAAEIASQEEDIDRLLSDVDDLAVFFPVVVIQRALQPVGLA